MLSIRVHLPSKITHKSLLHDFLSYCHVLQINATCMCKHLRRGQTFRAVAQTYESSVVWSWQCNNKNTKWITGEELARLLASIWNYTILYYTILYYTILYYTILYYTILYYTILYYTILAGSISRWGSIGSSCKSSGCILLQKDTQQCFHQGTSWQYLGNFGLQSPRSTWIWLYQKTTVCYLEAAWWHHQIVLQGAHQLKLSLNNAYWIGNKTFFSTTFIKANDLSLNFCQNTLLQAMYGYTLIQEPQSHCSQDVTLNLHFQLRQD